MKTKYFSLLIVVLFISSIFATISFLPKEIPRVPENTTKSASSAINENSVHKMNNEMLTGRNIDEKVDIPQTPSTALPNNMKDDDFAHDDNLAFLKETSPGYSNDLDLNPKPEDLVPIDGVSDYFYFQSKKFSTQCNTADSSIVRVVDNKIEMVIKTGLYFDRDLFESILENVDAEIIKFQNSLSAYLIKVPMSKVINLQSQICTLTDFNYMEPHFYRTLCFTPNDPSWEDQWGPQLIGLEDAWNLGTGNKSIIVAIVDTGIDYNHPDLINAYLPLGYDWYNNDSDPFDDHYHGTHVAGTIAATIHNAIGIAGVANVCVFVEKIFGGSGGYAGDIDAAAAIEHAAAQGARVISNSWGGGSYSQLIADAVDNAIANGAIVVFAAGNDGIDVVSFPASLPNVIAVSATDSSDSLAYFSSYGEEIDVAAPGVNILSTTPGNSYEYLSGTSMATPHVAGLIALILSQFPEYTIEEVKNLLYWSATDLGSLGFDIYYGHGRINASQASLGLPQHELTVTLEMSGRAYVTQSQLVNATVINYGLQTETSVNFSLFLDGMVVTSTIISTFESGTSYTLNYVWTPTAVGSYNFTAFAEYVPDETYLANNKATRLIPVVILTNYLESFPGYMWFNAQGNGYSLELSGHDVATYVDLPFNFMFYDQYFTRVYISSNGYLSFTDVYPSICYNYPFPLADYTYVIAPLWDSLRAAKNVYAFVTSEYVVIEYVDYYSTSGALYGTFAVVLFAYGGILFLYQDLYTYESPTVGLNYGIDTLFYNSYNESLADIREFAIGYNYISPEHELFAQLDLKSLACVNELQIVNASVFNGGLETETDVEFSLYLDGILIENVILDNLTSGARYTISYNWNPASIRVYNFTAYVIPIFNETFLTNNIATRLVLARDLSNYVESYTGYMWYDAQSNGYSLGLSGDDRSTHLDLPFNFTFYGENFTRVYISTNGWLSFTETNPYTYANPSFPTTAYNYVIAPLWDDLYAENNVYAYVTSEFVVIEYVDYYSLGGSLYGTFAVVLFAYGGILFLYQNIYSSLSPTVGLNFGLDPMYYNAYTESLAGLSEFAIGYNYIFPGHELFVRLDVNTYAHINATHFVNATVFNSGLENETDVEFSLSLDGTIVDSIILDNFTSGASYTLSYPWTPTSGGTYNFTAMVNPVFNETFITNNIASRLVRVLDLQGGWVAILNADGRDLPPYWTGSLENDYSSIGEGLNESGLSIIIITNDDIIAGILTDISVLILIDNAPNIAASLIVKAWWQAGGSILSFDSSITLLNWAGALPAESEGSNGYYTYWDYGSSYSGVLNDDSHPVTAGYTYGELIYGTSGDAQYFSAIMQGTAYGEYYTPLVKSAIGSNYDYVVAFDAPIGGKIVQIWDSYHWATTSNHLMILNAINWMLIRSEHDLSTQLRVNRYVAANSSQFVNATVYNYGLQTETNVEFSLSLDGIIVDSVILNSLASRAKYTLSYHWTPTSAGSYNFSASVRPVLNETYLINNVATRLVTVMDIHGGWVAILNADGSDIPSYWYGWYGSFYNDYDSIYEGVIASGIPAMIITNDDIIAGALTDVSVLILIDNVPNTAASSIVKVWWQAGGSILSFDTSICLLNWAGALPAESEGSNGYYTYWNYESSYSGVLIDDAHPVTAGYAYGETIYGSSGGAQYFSAIMQGTMYGEYYTPLVKSAIGSNYDYVVASETPIGGKIVQIWDRYHWTTTSNQLMILNAINWLWIRSEHDLSTQLRVNPYVSVNTTQFVNATVYNYGLQTETDVEFSLSLDGIVVESIILGSLVSEAKYTLSYLWIPTSAGSYNFTAFVRPVLNETFLTNNVATRFVTVTELVISDSIVITSDDDFIAYDFAGSGTLDDPYKIESLSISTPSYQYYAGIYINGTTKYFIITNCFIQIPMYFYSYGIFIDFIASGTGMIINNTIMNSYIGIVSFDSDSLTIGSNTLINNIYGIGVIDSSSNVIMNNVLRENHFGIGMQAADYNLFTYNWFVNNLEYGILDYGDDTGNQFYFNNFIAELVNSSLGYDDGIDNFWYNEELRQGNYWSNWGGEGSYPIDGTAGAVDLYPLADYCYFGPIISNVQYSPFAPTDQDIITITATIFDFIAITSVTVVYQVNGGDWQFLLMTVEGVTYSASCGPFGIGNTITLYLSALDTSNMSTSSDLISFIIADGTDPVIDNVQYLPAAPNDHDLIVITATVTDNVAVTSVIFVYRVNGSAWQTIAMTASGSTYSASIGPFSANSTVEFFITAQDAAKNVIATEIYSFTTTTATSTPPPRVPGFDLFVFVCVIIISAGILQWRKRARLNT